MTGEKLETFMIRGFRWYGQLVGRRPFWFLAVPFLFSCAMAPATVLITFEEDIILLFTPKNSPSRREQQTFREFSRMEASVSPDHIPEPRNEPSISPGHILVTKNQMKPQLNEASISHIPDTVDVARAPPKPRNYWWFTVCIIYKNQTNIMTPSAWRTMANVTKYVYQNFSCNTDFFGKLRYFPDFCDPNTGCVRMDKNFEKIVKLLPGGDLAHDPNVKLTYPMMEVFGTKINWGEFVFAGLVDNATGLLKEAKVVFIYLEFQFELNETMTKSAVQCMHQLGKHFYKLNGQGDLEFYPLHENMIKDELYKTKYYTLPFLAGTVLLVTFFSVISSIEIENTTYGALSALLGVWTIGLALVGSFGFMFVCGLYFNVMITITPFITMCVGIDNDFLMAAAWRQTDKRVPIHVRLGCAFAEVCPSLTITSLTDIVCFAVGTMIDTPAVSKFCLFTAVTLTFRYIYQVTFFAAVMAYSGILESNKFELDRHIIKNILHLLIKTQNVSSLSKLQLDFARSPVDFNCNSIKRQISSEQTEHYAHKIFRQFWARFIAKRSVRICTIIIFLIYICVSLFYALKIQVNIRAKKLMVDDSPLLKGLAIGEKYIFSNVVIGHGFVLNPPDFRNESNRKMMLDFLSALESTPYSTGSSTTTVWFREYLTYLEYFDTDTGPERYQSDFYQQLSGFLNSDSFSKYSSDLRYKIQLNQSQLDSGEPSIEKFKFRVYFVGAKTWRDHINLLLIWRRICAKFPQLDALFFDHTNLNPYFDQWLTLAPTTLQTTGIAIICISVVTALFMPDVVSTFFITLSFISIDIGVVGFLKLWDADLDPTTMACILMTIGFSIYYTARVCYCYQCADKHLKPEEKLARTMGSVGWPILQGGVATFLGIIPLVFVKSYMVRLFFKSVSLVVWFGLLHGLLFMPVIMYCLDNSAKTLKRTKILSFPADHQKR